MINTDIPIYGIFILISIVVGALIIFKNIQKLNYKKEENLGVILYIIMGTIYGAKYYTFFANYQKYNGIFDFTKIGLSSYGAVIGILAILFLFSLQFKKNYKSLILCVIPAIPLMYGIGKLGCFFAGCCHGIEYSGILSVTYNYSLSAPKGVSLFPVQLLEAIVFILLYFYYDIKTKKNENNNKVIGEIFALCGISKYLMEYLRMSHYNISISFNQIVSIMFIIIGFLIIFKPQKRKKCNK